MSPETFKKLVALGLSNEQISGVLEILQDTEKHHVDAREADREKARERWRKWDARRREKDANGDIKRLPTFANVSKQLARGGARVEDISPNLEINNKKEEREETRAARALPFPHDAFSIFWDIFPNKVGKRDAEKAFAKAMCRTSFNTIMDGLRRYVSKADDRPWCNPATFLNQDRWEDIPAPVQSLSRGPPSRPDTGRRRNYADAIADRMARESGNGTESLFGTRIDAQRLSARGGEPGFDAGDIRGSFDRNPKRSDC